MAAPAAGFALVAWAFGAYPGNVLYDTAKLAGREPAGVEGREPDRV